MTIKKKDGNVYILEGPNKLTKDQERIDLSKCVFHNFYWEEIVYNSKFKSDKKENKKLEEPVQRDKKIEIPVFEPEPPQPIETKQETKNVEKETDQEDFNFPILKVKVLMYCLPAKINSYKDNFYGENWQRINYGKKFIFPSVVISNNDLQIEFWTSDPRNQISEKSIIYPFSYEIYNKSTNAYDRVPYDEYRWWKVSSKEQKEGGYLIKAVPSEDHPDFSD